MRVAVIGAGGMLGQDLCPALRRFGHLVFPFDLERTEEIEQANIEEAEAVALALSAVRPELVAHLAAWTDVDGCSRDPARAFRVNAVGTWNVARACQALGAALLYISTDFVFDGEKREPYTEFDRPNPLSPYGASKLAGEEYVRSLIPAHFIVRTAWLYGAGGKNFVKTILDRARSRQPLRVVADQVGSPTWSRDLAEGIVRLIEQPIYGTYHLAGGASCSWADLAEEAIRLAGIEARVERISWRDWPSPTKRPEYSALVSRRLELQGREGLRDWREALREFVIGLGD